MMIAIIILLLYSAINLCEAWLEKIVIDLKDPRLKNYRELNDEEHFRSLVLACLIAVSFLSAALFLGLYWLAPAILINRRIFFDYFLKKFRNKDGNIIEGEGWFDSQFRNVFGADGGYKELAVEILVTIVSLLLCLNNHNYV